MLQEAVFFFPFSMDNIIIHTAGLSQLSNDDENEMKDHTPLKTHNEKKNKIKAMQTKIV